MSETAGRVDMLDTLAAKFMTSDDRNAVVEETVKACEDIPDK